jgi:hypothetical protein
MIPFMGKEVVRGGVAAILERYRKAYSTREATGTLTFSKYGLWLPVWR